MISPPTLEFYRIGIDPPPVHPALGRREWMDRTTDRHAYRCIPMTIANASGWELRCPFAFEASWDGGDGLDAISITTAVGPDRVEQLVASHFGHGILTFHTGWLIRTSLGWATLARGSPNRYKDGILALEGLIETDWLPFPFTMNWQFVRPGSVNFEAGEPLCFMTPIAHVALDFIQPRTADLADNPEIAEEYSKWQESRSEFNARLQAREPQAVQQGWQKGYVRADGMDRPTGYHKTERVLYSTIDRCEESGSVE